MRWESGEGGRVVKWQGGKGGKYLVLLEDGEHKVS